MSRGGDARRWIDVQEDPIPSTSQPSSTSSFTTTLFIELWKMIISVSDGSDESSSFSLFVDWKERALTISHFFVIFLVLLLAMLLIRRYIRVRVCKQMVHSN